MKNLVFILLFCFSLYAQDIVFSKEVHDGLKSANIHIKAQEYKKAVDILQKIVSKKDEEKAYIDVALGQAYLGFNDFVGASKYFEKALKIEILPKDLYTNTLYNLLQIYLIGQNHKKVVAIFSQYALHVKNIKPDIYASVAISYLKLKNHKQALTYIAKALELEPKNEKFMQSLLAIYYDKKDYKRVCTTLELAYKLSMLKDSYTEQIAHCLYKNNAPLRGANFLKSAIAKGKISNTKANKTLLFNLYLEAKELKLAYEVAKSIGNAKVSLAIIQSLFDKGKYQQTITATTALYFTLDLKNRALVDILKAQSYYYLDNIKEATKLFQQALKNPITKSIAQEWIDFIGE